MSDPYDTRVIDRLERLAGHAPTHLDHADQLWAHGRRRQRSRWAAGAVATAVVSAIGTLLVPSVLAEVQPPQAAAGDGFVLPDVVRQPGPWEPAFPAVPGRLSAVGVGTRSGLWGSSGAPWGVSAATGESRFLDLPGVVWYAGDPQLSADGRRLAYWVTGDVAKGPLPEGMDQDPVVGIAVLDLVSGDVRRWEVDSDHGLGVTGAAWAGDVLWWSAGPTRDAAGAATATKVDVHTWNAATGERRDLSNGPGGGLFLGEGIGDAPDGFVVRSAAQWRLRRVVGDDDPTSIRLVAPDEVPDDAGIAEPTMSADGSRVAMLLLPDQAVHDDDAKDVLVGEVVDGVARLVRLEGVQAQGIAGWRSPAEVVLTDPREVAEGRQWQARRAWAVDVTTGERSPLLEFSGSTPQVAAEAWTADLVPAPDAPFAPDPRLVVLGGAVTITFLVSLWRSIRGRRGHP